MPCNHKFINDLQLQYVDWEVKTLFIGTFNPHWKSCENNYAAWFYGRVQRNEFWCILPTCHNDNSLLNADRIAWIDFCRKHRVAVTDIIDTLGDANENDPIHLQQICNFDDDNLANFDIIINDIPTILQAHPTINRICITRKTLSSFWQSCFAETFRWINAHPERAISILYLRSPSRRANKGVRGPFCQFIANNWLAAGY